MTIHCFTNPTDACDQSLLVAVQVCMQIGQTQQHSQRAPFYKYAFFSKCAWIVKLICKEPIPNMDVQ